jgi:hypothetical protein
MRKSLIACWIFTAGWLIPVGLGHAQNVLPTCKGGDVSLWHECRGIVDEADYSYAGDFGRGKFEGRGILEFTANKYQGDYYQGEFKSGMKHGFGIYFFANGEKYAGQYQFGKRHGKGTYSFPDGRAALSGTWSNNQFLGKPAATNESKTADKTSSGLMSEIEKKKTDGLSVSPKKSSGTQPINPSDSIATSKTRDAVAIIVGIENYNKLPIASFAANDASEFRAYATRFLGIAPGNVKLLVDSQAQRADILLAFKYWLPARVNKGRTDVYVFFSGHGVMQETANLPYWLPFDVNTDLLEDTAVSQTALLTQLNQLGAKSVTVFLDTCFSGTNRSGQVLAAQQRGVSIKKTSGATPAMTNVLSAGSRTQSAYGDANLQHGVFSFYLLKGLAGAADTNRDKLISLGELADYVSSQTSRHALGMQKIQEPQLTGDRQHMVAGR